MIWKLVLMCLLALTQAKQGVYHELSASWLKGSPDKITNAYFGYSVTYVPSSKRLIVSAPQEDTIGEIYSCNMDAKKDPCLKMKNKPKIQTLRKDARTYNHNLWLGATVKAGPNYFVTCTPLAVDRRNYSQLAPAVPTMGTFSRCFKYQNEKNPPARLGFISEESRTMNAKLLEHAMDSFGWSIDVDDNDVIIGGPALFTGRAINYDLSDNKKEVQASLTGFINENNMSKSNGTKRVQYNFGYSVAVGYFTKYEKKKIFAVGSPYGEKGFGKVSFYEIQNKRVYLNSQNHVSKDGSLDLKTNDEFAVGSMFGAVLCAARLTEGSTATALVVGAPTYASAQRQQYNRGAVYFYAPGELPLRNLLRKIVGTVDNGFFGSAIARLGDYNGDGLDEIAISAPHEDNGAVYIYSSAVIMSRNEKITYMQRIVPSPPSSVISFGLSLTSVQDYDENGCNELAIGAPESNTVMVLKCIAALTLKLNETEDLILRIDSPLREENHFTFPFCMEVTFPEKPNVIFANINVSVRIEDHPNATLASEKSYQVSLNRGRKVICNNIKVSAPKGGDYRTPIIYTLKATLQDDPELMKEFDPSHVSLSELSVLKSSGRIWLTECKDVEHCNPKLNLTKTITAARPYVIGSPEKIKLSMFVRNEGETAYDACVQVFAPRLTASGVPLDCKRPDDSVGQLICRPPGAVEAYGTWDIPEIMFDSSQLTMNDENVNISIALHNDCSLMKPEWQYELIALEVDYSKISIKGIVDSGVSTAVNMSKDDIDGQTFEHSYTITSGGLTDLANLTVNVYREKQPFIEYGPIYISSENSEHEQCLEVPGNDTMFTCALEKLNNKQPAKVTVLMKIISPELLDIAIKEKRNTQNTLLILDLNKGGTQSASLENSFNLGGQVKIWIIVVASLVGLLILLILFLVLQKCGFFNRENKKNLNIQRKSVRRQTMMRKTLMEGVRAPLPGSDRQSLINSLPQETADEAAARDRRVRLDSNATKRK